MVAGVGVALTGTVTARAAAVSPAVHSIAGVVVLAPVAGVRAARTGASPTVAAAVSPAIDVDAGICE